MFGEHTFFLDQNGLNIVQLEEFDPDGGPTGKLVRVASWSGKEQLKAHDPEPTDMVVMLGPEQANGQH
jgi:hypothetical protein